MSVTIMCKNCPIRSEKGHPNVYDCNWYCADEETRRRWFPEFLLEADRK